MLYPLRVPDAAKTDALLRAEGLEPSPKAIERVANATSEEAATWAFTQWNLRKRAEGKFERAREMLFTREALEQATHERLAAHHASRFPEGVLVADLTAGIGADLIALAGRGAAVGYETDPERAEYARHNLRVHGLEAEIRVQSSVAARWEFELAFADPGRRVSGARTLNPDDFQPNPVQLANRMSALDFGLMKLTPMLPDRFLSELGRTDFISFGGECREALVSVGRAGEPRAQHLESGEILPSGMAPSSVELPLSRLFEADPAAIRADALDALSEAHGLKALGDSNGYLTGEGDVESPWLTAYEVLAFHRADVAATRKALEMLDSGTPIVKSRAGVDVEALRKALKMSGKEPLIVAVYAVGKSLRHVIVRKARA